MENKLSGLVMIESIRDVESKIIDKINSIPLCHWKKGVYITRELGERPSFNCKINNIEIILLCNLGNWKPYVLIRDIEIYANIYDLCKNINQHIIDSANSNRLISLEYILDKLDE